MRAKTAVKRLMKMCGCITPFLLAYLFLMNFNKTRRWPMNHTLNIKADVSRPNINHDDERVQPRPANVRQLAKYFPCSEESRIDAMETAVVLPNAENVTKDTSVVTGSIYVDRDLLNEFKGEGQTENVMVIKTHELASRHRRTYNRAVILIRHPADTILALYNYERSRSHTGHVDKWMFETDDWKLFVQSNIFSWQRFYQSWTQDFSGPKFYLSYARLQTDFNTEVLRLAQFLDISVTFQKLWCLKREMESGFHRNKASWIDRGSFNNDMMKALNQSASLVKKALTNVFNTSVEDLI